MPFVDEVWGKVMFSQVSVCPQGCLPLGLEGCAHPTPEHTYPQTHLPPEHLLDTAPGHTHPQIPAMVIKQAVHTLLDCFLVLEGYLKYMSVNQIDIIF